MAIQEVKRDTSGLRLLVEHFLGSNWGVILSDVSAGTAGNTERLAFVYDKRRVSPSGLVGEIVLPPTPEGNPQDQFARIPYIVGFKVGGQNFVLLTAHIKYGTVPEDRLAEIQSLARCTAAEIRDRANTPSSEEKNLIVLGDFNIDKRGDNPLFQAFVSTGLKIPPQLNNLKTTLNTDPKYYDQIGWFMDQDFELQYTERAGTIDFVDAIFKELSSGSMTYRISDHFPLWVEFHTDRSVEQMALKLGLEEHQIAMPDPLQIVPD